MAKIVKPLISLQRGASKITFLVFGTLVGALLFVGYNVLPFYYCYYEIQSHMDQIVRIASMTSDEEMRSRLWKHIRQLDIPVEPEALKIMREEDKITVSLDYYEVFYITWKNKDYDLRTFHFNAVAQADLPRGG